VNVFLTVSVMRQISDTLGVGQVDCP